jgi:hypothetical protein
MAGCPAVAGPRLSPGSIITPSKPIEFGGDLISCHLQALLVRQMTSGPAMTAAWQSVNIT